MKGTIDMGKWIEQQTEKSEKRELDKERKDALSKYFLNLSQLTFAALVVGVVVPIYSNFQDERNWYAVITGAMLTAAFALIGNKILKG